MIIDINAYLGHWPFRPIPDGSAVQLLSLMDRKGIDVAVVSSLDAILYKNSQAGNEALAAEIASHRDRFIPLATINPTYAAWREDVAYCQEGLGMAGIRIYPAYHGYSLNGPECDQLLGLAAERGLPVAIPLRMEDRRQRHWRDTAEDISPAEIAATIERFPGVSFMILNGIGDTETWANLKDREVLIDISRLSNLRRRPGSRDVSIPALIESLGADKLAFGTGIPIKVPDPALLKLEILEASPEVKEAIAWRNAARVLGVEVSASQ
jgi:predicted TIM-barrel fold metal-dependent hydrolase